MARKFLTPVGLPSGASTPAAGTAGDLFFNTTDDLVYVHDGTAWSAVGAGGSVDGLPTGGTEGQILAKTDDTNYNTEWIDNYAPDTRIIIKNDSGVTLSKGTPVMAVGAVGDRIRVAKAVADGSVESRFMLGVMFEEVADGSEGFLTLTGEVTGLNTIAYSIGTTLYIDPDIPGTFTATQPVSPDLAMSIAIVTRAHASTGRIFVRMWSQQAGLHELHDVLIDGTPADNEVLAYDSSGGVWKNQTAAEANLSVVGHTHSIANVTSLQDSLNAKANLAGASFTGAISTTGALAVDGGSITSTDTTFDLLTGASTITVGAGTGNVNFQDNISAEGYITARRASTQDAVRLLGRAGGTNTYDAIVTPTTLTASRTFTLPDTTGTLITTGDSNTVTTTMLAGSITNAKLSNSSVTLGSTALTLGATVASVAGLTSVSSSTLTSTVAIGTAPLTVTSTTQVTNLRAQFAGTANTANAVAVANVSGLGANVATFLATPSSANLLNVMTTETGTGNLVFSTSPTLTTPILANSTTTATSGLLDFDGTVFYSTASTTPGKALDVASYYYLSSAQYSPNMTSGTNAISLLGTSTRGITVAAGTTYDYEAMFAITGFFVVTSQIPTINLTSTTVTLSPVVTHQTVIDAGDNLNSGFGTAITLSTTRFTGTGRALTGLTTGTRYYIVKMRGRIAVTGTGTVKIYPSIRPNQGSTDNEWTVEPGAMFKLTPIGNGTATTVGTWA